MTDADLIRRGDWWWPRKDRHCFPAVTSTVSDMDVALRLVANRRIAVQAGGNCGVWANYLARQFQEVYTAEPDVQNYLALQLNRLDNVFAECCAYGDHIGSVGLDVVQDNVGAHSISVSGGSIKVLTIDSLCLPYCDYLCLDVEGYEMLALRGAYATIKANKPVIQLEDKGLSEKYGFAVGDAEKWLTANFDYTVVARVHRDVILVP